MTSCWIVTEGLAGTENQCLGVAEALGVIPVIKRIGLRQPWRLLSPWLGCEQSWTFTGDTMDTPWPDLVIASGRKSIAAARYIKKQNAGKSFVVQIQDPRIQSSSFDLIAVPAHDQLRGDNVIVTHAAPNRVSPQKLDEARDEFAGIFRTLSGPRVAVLIGGNSKTHRMTQSVTQTLCDHLVALDEKGYALMVTASRRTGHKNRTLLADTLKYTRAFLWSGRTANPYFGMLAWADFILVTNDSASMISEAATTGKPVYVISMEGHSAKFDRLHAGLREQGIIRPFTGQLETYTYKPLQDAAVIAAAIREKMGKSA